MPVHSDAISVLQQDNFPIRLGGLPRTEERQLVEGIDQREHTMLLYAAIWAAFYLRVLGSPAPSHQYGQMPHHSVVHERHEQRHLEGWSKAEPAELQALLPIRIGLTQSNLQKGHDMLMDM